MVGAVGRVVGAPHPVQNFAPGLSGFPQAVQNVGAGGGASSFEPQKVQKIASSLSSWPHFGQSFIVIPLFSITFL